MWNRIKKTTKIFSVVLLVFAVGGLGGIVFDRYLLPKLSTNSFFAKLDLIKMANENVTVINKTEQVVVREDLPIGDVISKASASVVEVISASGNVAFAGDMKKGGASTGLIISNDGVIMTHKDAVVVDGGSYKVFTSDSSYDAKLIGVDDYMDVAFFKVDASNLPVIPFADSNTLRSGQRLIAIGDFPNTSDKVSAVGFMEGFEKTFNLAGKTSSYSDKLEGVLAMSFDCSEGYVGGPVINYNGELVGVTGRIIIDNKVKYFQIPSNSIKDVVGLVFRGNLEKRAKLGVYYVPITKMNAQSLNVSREAGALVYSSSNKQGLAVVSNLAGDKSGIKIGDLILSINGEAISLEKPLSALVGKYLKGESVTMIVLRNGQEMELKIEF